MSLQEQQDRRMEIDCRLNNTNATLKNELTAVQEDVRSMVKDQNPLARRMDDSDKKVERKMEQIRKDNDAREGRAVARMVSLSKEGVTS